MKKEIIFVLALLLFAPLASAQGLGQGITSDLEKRFENASPNEKVDVIVVSNERLSESQIGAIESDGGNVSERFDLVNAVLVSVPKQAAEAIANRPFVERIEPDYDVETVLDSSVENINTEQVWDTNTTGKDIEVSIIDTGIENNNENLNVVEEIDFTGEGTDDLNGHGTHVAGIVASQDEKYRGVSYDANIYDAKALDSEGSGYASDVISAIEWSVENDAEIISLSLGARVDSCDGNDILSEAVDKAVSEGSVAVVSAGNYGPEEETITIPGCSNRAITVGASDENGNVADFSSRGPTADGRVKPDVVAPGVGITSTWNDGDFQSLSGTSMSAPHVSGVVALMLSENSELSPSEIKETMISDSTDLGHDPNTQGGGKVNALEAYQTIKLNETESNETEQNETEENETRQDNETDNNVSGLPPGLANKSDLPPGLENRSTLPSGLRRQAGSLPGSLGHGIDRAFESINLALTFNEEKKAEKRLEYAQERLSEARVASERNKAKSVEKAVEQYEKTLEKAEKQAEKSNNSEIKEKIENTTRNSQEVLKEVYNKVPEQAKPSIENAMNRSPSREKPQNNGRGENQSSGNGQKEENGSKGRPENPGRGNNESESPESSNESNQDEKNQTQGPENQANNSGNSNNQENSNSNADSSEEAEGSENSGNSQSNSQANPSQKSNSGSTNSPAPTSSGPPSNPGSSSGSSSSSSNGGPSGNSGGKPGKGPTGNSFLSDFF